MSYLRDLWNRIMNNIREYVRVGRDRSPSYGDMFEALMSDPITRQAIEYRIEHTSDDTPLYVDTIYVDTTTPIPIRQYNTIKPIYEERGGYNMIDTQRARIYVRSDSNEDFLRQKRAIFNVWGRQFTQRFLSTEGIHHIDLDANIFHGNSMDARFLEAMQAILYLIINVGGLESELVILMSPSTYYEVIRFITSYGLMRIDTLSTGSTFELQLMKGYVTPTVPNGVVLFVDRNTVLYDGSITRPEYCGYISNVPFVNV